MNLLWYFKQQGLSLKASTICRYPTAASEFSIASNVMNPYLDVTYKRVFQMKLNVGNLSHTEESLLQKETIEFIYNKRLKLLAQNPRYIYSTLADWLILEQESSFRCKKWAQDR